MKKILAILIYVSCFTCVSMAAFTVKDEENAHIEVVKTLNNYYLATLVGESEYYAPLFYEDHELLVDGQAVLHFTKINNIILDFYYYITDESELQLLRKIFRTHRDKLDSFSEQIYGSLIVYRGTVPQYEMNGLHKNVEKLIKDSHKVTLHRVIGENPHLEKIDAALFQYLKSNGIESFEALKNRPDILAPIVDKFYMLCTTYFFRDWAHIDAFLQFVPHLYAKAEKENRPLKLKVFACSTGEEVLSYCIDLLEMGIKNFTILGTDINPSSLEFASSMVYSSQTIERLPKENLDKIKKYFKKNNDINVWEPKDPELFKSRIIYQTQDLLSELPKDLDDRFKGPYDLVSILNVLLYLEDDAIQVQKEYWYNLLSEDGVLVLRDAKYSVGRGTLGQTWYLDKLIPVNEWVNFKISKNLDAESVENLFLKYHGDLNDEFSFNILSTRYFVMNQVEKNQHLIDQFIQKHPLSFKALSLGYAFYKQQRNQEKCNMFLDALFKTHYQQIFTLKTLAEVNPKEKNFKHLINNYLHFLTHYRTMDTKEALSSYDLKFSSQFEMLPLLFKAMAISMIQNSNIKIGKLENLEEFSLEGFKLVQSIYNKYPEFINVAKFLNNLLEGLVTYYKSVHEYEKALQYCNQGIEMYQNGFKNKNYFYVSDGLGYLSLQKAILNLEISQLDGIDLLWDDAVFYYEKARPSLKEMHASAHSYFYQNIGESYLGRGKYWLGKDNIKRAINDFKYAMKYFEQALGINPLYGKDAYLRREELIRILKENGIEPDAN